MSKASYACATCSDTHEMTLHRDGHEDRVVACTRCPTPCSRCRGHAQGGGRTAYCAATPCGCACHGARAGKTHFLKTHPEPVRRRRLRPEDVRVPPGRPRVRGRRRARAPRVGARTAARARVEAAALHRRRGRAIGDLRPEGARLRRARGLRGARARRRRFDGLAGAMSFPEYPKGGLVLGQGDLAVYDIEAPEGRELEALKTEPRPRG